MLLPDSFLSIALGVSSIFIGWSIPTQSSIYFHPYRGRTLLGVLYSFPSFNSYALRYINLLKFLNCYLGISILKPSPILPDFLNKCYHLFTTKFIVHLEYYFTPKSSKLFVIKYLYLSYFGLGCSTTLNS